MILDTICKKLKSKHPKIRLITIHDSSYTTPQYVDIVREIMITEIYNVIGHCPKVKVEDYKIKIEELEADQNRKAA